MKTLSSFGRLFVSIGNIFLCGFVIVMLWSWFITPTFGLVKLNMPQALGLDLVVTFFTFRFSYIDIITEFGFNEDEKEKYPWIKIVLTTLFGLGMLLMGFIIKQFM